MIFIIERDSMKRNRKTYRRQNRNSGKSIFIKTAACIAGIGVLMLIASTYRSYIIKEEKAPYLTVKEFLPELEAFSDVLGMTLYSDFINNMEYSPEEYITVKDVKSILQSFPKVGSTIPDEYKKDSWYIGLNDWNVLLLEMVEQYGGDNIFTTELLLLGNEENIVEQSGNILSAGSVLTDRGIMEAVFWDTDKYMYSNVSAVCYNGNILSVLGYGKQPGLLRNIYFSDASENSVHFFVKNFHIRYFGGEEAESTEEGTIPKDMEADGPVIKPDVSGLSGESIVDLQFDRGTVSIMKKETEYIHGKLLQVSDEGIEVEGYGIFKPDDEMEIYRLYSELSTMDKKDLRIGYAFTDFVLENGKVVACLMMKEEDMEYDDPEIVKKGNKNIVKMKAGACSYHILKIDVETQVSPFIGANIKNEEMVENWLESFEEDYEKLWDSKMFRKTLKTNESAKLFNK